MCKNREIYGLLKNMDCYYAQGYYINRPFEENRFND